MKRYKNRQAKSTARALRKMALTFERMNDLEMALQVYDRELRFTSQECARARRILKRKDRVRMALEVDTTNREKFGDSAPRFAERIWVHPSMVKRQISAENICGIIGREASATVITHWPEESVSSDYTERGKLVCCKKHWIDGLSWQESGIYELMMRRIREEGKKDKCKNLSDVIERYAELDKIFATIQREQKVRTQKQLDRNAFREYFGIFIHLGPDGEPLFGSRGFHRFAIASILNIWMPCQIGAVHVSALGALPEYRKPPRERTLVRPMQLEGLHLQSAKPQNQDVLA